MGNAAIDGVGDHLTQNVQTALEIIAGRCGGAALDENLAMHRLGGFDVVCLRQTRIVDRYGAPAQNLLPFGGDDVFHHLFAARPQGIILRHKDEADRIVARIVRQADTIFSQNRAEKGIRLLQQHACAVAHERVGANRAPVCEVFQNLQTVTNDTV